MTDEAMDLHSSANKLLEAEHLISNFDEFLKKILLHFREIKKKVVALIEVKNEQVSYQR